MTECPEIKVVETQVATSHFGRVEVDCAEFIPGFPDVLVTFFPREGEKIQVVMGIDLMYGQVTTPRMLRAPVDG